MLSRFSIVKLVNMLFVDKPYVWSTLIHMTNVFMPEQLLALPSKYIAQLWFFWVFLRSAWYRLQVLKRRVSESYVLGVFCCGRDLEVFPFSRSLLCVPLDLHLGRDHSKVVSARHTAPQVSA